MPKPKEDKKGKTSEKEPKKQAAQQKKKEEKAAKELEKKELEKQKALTTAKENISKINVDSGHSEPFKEFLKFYKAAGDLRAQALQDQNCIEKFVAIIIYNTSTNAEGKLELTESLLYKLSGKLSENKVALLKEIIETPEVKDELEEKLRHKGNKLEKDALEIFFDKLTHKKKSEAVTDKVRNVFSNNLNVVANVTKSTVSNLAETATSFIKPAKEKAPTPPASPVVAEEKTSPEEQRRLAQLTSAIETHKPAPATPAQTEIKAAPVTNPPPPPPTDVLPPPVISVAVNIAPVKTGLPAPTELPPAPPVKSNLLATKPVSSVIPPPPPPPVQLASKPLVIPQATASTKPKEPVDHMGELSRKISARGSKTVDVEAKLAAEKAKKEAEAKNSVALGFNMITPRSKPQPSASSTKVTAPIVLNEEEKAKVAPLHPNKEEEIIQVINKNNSLRELIKKELLSLGSNPDLSWYSTRIRQTVNTDHRNINDENKDLVELSRTLSKLNFALNTDETAKKKFNAHVAPHLNKLIMDIFVNDKTTRNELSKTLADYRDGGSVFIASYATDNAEKQHWNNMLCAVAYAAAVVAGIVVGVAIGAAVVAATAATGGLALPFIGTLTFGSAALLGGTAGFGLGNIVGGVAALIKNSVFKPVTAPTAVTTAMVNVDDAILDVAGITRRENVL